MQQYLQIFEYEDHNRIRSVNIDGEIWFVALDVCKSLGIQNPSSAYTRIDKDDLGETEVVDSMGRRSKSYIVSEFGLYDLILDFEVRTGYTIVTAHCQNYDANSFEQARAMHNSDHPDTKITSIITFTQ